jgi:hypothetical protein
MVILDRDIRRSSVKSTSALDFEGKYIGYGTDGRFGVIAKSNFSTSFFTAMSIPDSPTSPNAKKLLRYDMRDVNIGQVSYPTTHNIKDVRWMFSSLNVLVLHDFDSGKIQVFSAVSSVGNTAQISELDIY